MKSKMLQPRSLFKPFCVQPSPTPDLTLLNGRFEVLSLFLIDLVFQTLLLAVPICGVMAAGSGLYQQLPTYDRLQFLQQPGSKH